MTDIDILKELETPPAPRRGGFGLGSVLLLTGIVLASIVFGVALARQQSTQPRSGPAPDFTITTFDGQPFTLSEQRGQVVVLNFWASWCGPCRDEAPFLETVWQTYRDHGVVVVGVTHADTERDARRFIEEFGMTFPNGADLGTVITKEQYFIQGVPETFVIDQEGNVADFYYLLTEDLQPRLLATLDRLTGASS